MKIHNRKTGFQSEIPDEVILFTVTEDSVSGFIKDEDRETCKLYIWEIDENQTNPPTIRDLTKCKLLQ